MLVDTGTNKNVSEGAIIPLTYPHALMHAIEKHKCNFGGSVFQVVWSFWISGNQAFKNAGFFPHILLESSFFLTEKPQQLVPYGYA